MSANDQRKNHLFPKKNHRELNKENTLTFQIESTINAHNSVVGKLGIEIYPSEDSKDRTGAGETEREKHVAVG